MTGGGDPAVAAAELSSYLSVSEEPRPNPIRRDFLSSNTMTGAGKELLLARLSDEAEQPNWNLSYGYRGKSITRRILLRVFSGQTKMPPFAYSRSPMARE